MMIPDVDEGGGIQKEMTLSSLFHPKSSSFPQIIRK
jgi:hypothetical protein